MCTRCCAGHGCSVPGDRKEKSLSQACGQEKGEPLSQKLEPKAQWPLLGKGQFHPLQRVYCAAGILHTLPYLILKATRGRHGYHSCFTVEGTAAPRGEETGLRSNSWKQQSPNSNPNPLQPKAFPLSLLCDCHIPSLSLGRL